MSFEDKWINGHTEA